MYMQNEKKKFDPSEFQLHFRSQVMAAFVFPIHTVGSIAMFAAHALHRARSTSVRG